MGDGALERAGRRGVARRAEAESAIAPLIEKRFLVRGGPNDAVYSVAYAADVTVKLWKAPTGRLLLTLRGHTDGVYLVAYSPDGAVLARGSSDSTVKLWEANTGLHCCPARSRIESIGCWRRVNRRWSRRPEGPVKWAFSRIASRSRSVEFGRGWRPARDASGRWRRGHKRTRRSRFASSLRSRWSRRML